MIFFLPGLLGNGNSRCKKFQTPDSGFRFPIHMAWFETSAWKFAASSINRKGRIMEQVESIFHHTVIRAGFVLKSWAGFMQHMGV